MMKTIYIFLIGSLFWSCAEEKKPEEIKEAPKYDKEQSIEMFKGFAEEEKEEIENFIMRHPDWKLQFTETGLYYSVYKPGEGENIQYGQTAVVRYEISGLDGSVYYKSDSLKTESFKVDKADIESGIHQGIKYMNKGSKAKFIIPSHLAHGLIGDMDKIPALASVIYDVELVDIQ
ncbi:MAG: FKBP-type peptidyl-prolyl cis-trans isomerase [Crocinitomicaceae bacterium]|nr:FKBP-type peptidyl-prolyl cis-trans isomerase [Crocinitomicaceae bacterium]